MKMEVIWYMQHLGRHVHCFLSNHVKVNFMSIEIAQYH
jgi:hypothetical protein